MKSSSHHLVPLVASVLTSPKIQQVMLLSGIAEADETFFLRFKKGKWTRRFHGVAPKIAQLLGKATYD